MKTEAMKFGRADSGPKHKVGVEVSRDKPEQGWPEVSFPIHVYTGSRKALQVK